MDYIIHNSSEKDLMKNKYEKYENLRNINYPLTINFNSNHKSSSLFLNLTINALSIVENYLEH
jgi:hypothetical protein